MIDWDRTAEIECNNIPPDEMESYFRKFPGSGKKVVRVCEECGDVKVLSFDGISDLCHGCANRTPEHRAKQSNDRKGKKASPKACANMSKAAMGKKKLPRARVNMSKAKIGKKKPLCTTEARQHLSAAAQGIPYDEWESFAKEQKYCPRFNETCKESNRNKYGRRCFICNKTEKANGQKLSVHHVDMDRAQGCESNWKLVPLCRSCHSSAHNNELIARLGYLIKDNQKKRNKK